MPRQKHITSPGRSAAARTRKLGLWDGKAVARASRTAAAREAAAGVSPNIQQDRERAEALAAHEAALAQESEAGEPMAPSEPLWSSELRELGELFARATQGRWSRRRTPEKPTAADLERLRTAARALDGGRAEQAKALRAAVKAVATERHPECLAAVAARHPERWRQETLADIAGEKLAFLEAIAATNIDGPGGLRASIQAAVARELQARCPSLARQVRAPGVRAKVSEAVLATAAYRPRAGIARPASAVAEALRSLGLPCDPRKRHRTK